MKINNINAIVTKHYTMNSLKGAVTLPRDETLIDSNNIVSLQKNYGKQRYTRHSPYAK